MLVVRETTNMRQAKAPRIASARNQRGCRVRLFKGQSQVALQRSWAATLARGYGPASEVAAPQHEALIVLLELHPIHEPAGFASGHEPGAERRSLGRLARVVEIEVRGPERP